MESLKRTYMYEGSCKLIATLLKLTYKDYKRALIYTYMNKQFYLDHIDEVNEYMQYRLDCSEYSRITNLNKNKYRPDELAFLEYFEIRPVIKKPKRHVTTIVNTYIIQKNIQIECESFYMSKDYEIFTMNKGKKGIDVIYEIRNKAAKVIKRNFKKKSKKIGKKYT